MIENLKQKKKNFMTALGFVVISIANSDTLSEKDEILIYDVIKGLKQIILEQERENIKQNFKKILGEEWRKLIEIYTVIKTYNKKKKGELINLWNDLDKLYKSEQRLDS